MHNGSTPALRRMSRSPDDVVAEQVSHSVTSVHITLHLISTTVHITKLSTFNFKPLPAWLSGNAGIYWPSRLKALVAMGPAIQLTCVVC